MDIVKFNGLGQPMDSITKNGEVLILVQGELVSVVRVELVDPNQYGPVLHHATNEADLAQEALSLVKLENPECLHASRHYTLRCPQLLATKAVFNA